MMKPHRLSGVGAPEVRNRNSSRQFRNNGGPIRRMKAVADRLQKWDSSVGTREVEPRSETLTICPAAKFAVDPAVVLLTADQKDIAFLEAIFSRQQWKLHTFRTLSSGLEFLRRSPIPVVITEPDLGLAGWKDVIDQTQDLPYPPVVVVASRLADDSLWAEVLNRGGHDVISKPLGEFEILWVLRHALGIIS